MNCEILSTVYVRSNGDVCCNDDAGETLVLSTAADKGWSFSSTFQNQAYSHIRDSFIAGKMPWPQHCARCAFFRPNEPFFGSILKSEIRKVQIEPSLVCNLRCPCCSQAQQITERPKPFLMKAQLFEKILGSIQEGEFRVREIEYCGQGEPLMNRDFPEFVRLARRYFPKTCQRLITNGNFDYLEAAKEEPIDEIFVSCDGVRQNSYERYRVHGKVNLALNFMRDIPKHINTQQQHVIWKYILFEFNDSDEEIWEAQHMAQELKVDTLLFVYTHSQFRSQRYTVNNAAEFPIYYENVKTNATPIHYRRELRNEIQRTFPMRLRQALVRILE